jgi:crossover junction endodeoxyribonuclease RuvC
MRILGIDPGLTITGYGLIEMAVPVPRLVEAGSLKCPVNLPLERRLLELHRGLSEIIEAGKPAMMAVESLFSNYKHPTSALQMAHARGVLFLAAAEVGIEVFSYEPARVKKSLVGRGRATKSQMQNMIQSLFSLEAPPDPPDVADAIAVALCHANAMREGNPTRGDKEARRLPEAVQLAMDKTKRSRRSDSVLEILIGRAGGGK